MTSTAGLEEALAAAEADIDAAAKAAATVTRALRKARAAAVSGQVRDMRRALGSADELVAELQQRVREAETSYDVDESQSLASGAYAKELLAAASDAGLAMVEEEDRLLCYPSIVRLLPADQALDIDRKRSRGIRPTVVVARLLRLQQAGRRSKPEPFLASLLAGYDLVLARQGKSRGTVVRLLDIYGVLTILPGQSREYSKAEFARDLYQLDQSGVVASRAGGPRIRWAASTGTRDSGVLTTVAKSGQQQRYWGIAFEGAER